MVLQDSQDLLDKGMSLAWVLLEQANAGQAGQALGRQVRLTQVTAQF